ncbi:type I-B CRISPR-associated protein Cas7/Csh2 [Hydrogenobacter hydrogenophilus]|uniref:CRISPR-associated protein Csh2 n=1 Tax=Hydrogenobacter hydrogenophilus TaxID=35835 RepID=A0A285P2A8_9AQUI|nr:type I-B CRISPR-associated protein Cas7/Csh2 [Hydrogenobacter hydrogenophilus]SNZ15588.1 CRISPR-associated protein Csh2 [Hydrogenobacter hydrogenophilus]
MENKQEANKQAPMKNRREILFIYDVSWANPNGDPADENKPRIDEGTQINYVTPDRLKRTIRDQLAEMGYEIFIREERGEDGKLSTKEDIFEKYGNDYAKMLENCIDIRLFGGTFAIKKNKNKRKKGEEEEDNQEASDTKANSFTGPVQFKFGRSLHRVKMELVKGTTVLPSKEGKAQGNMTDRYVVPYSLIVFYGIANEKAAEETKLTESDIDTMLKAMWIGHKASTDVISYSKFGHNPRVLIEIIYKDYIEKTPTEKNLTHIGELDKLVRIQTDKKDEEIRDIEELNIDFTKLQQKVQRYKDKIQKVRYCIDDRVKFFPAIEEIFQGIQVEEFCWAKEV